MFRLSGFFYQFTGLHAFLTGLMPFFLPVILWRETESLALVSGFISLSGIGFLAGMGLWEGLRIRGYSRAVIAGSFVAETVLVSVLVLENASVGLTDWGVIVLALLNGIYGCFYWLSLRAMFVSHEESGRKQHNGNRFGNFQLVVGILLKVGILAGAWLLEARYDVWLVALSVLFAIAGIKAVYSSPNCQAIAMALEQPSVRFRDITGFRSGNWSRTVFVLDGLFLFLESYFWVLSLYLVSQQSFTRLGIIIVGLAVLLSLLFLLIKRHIDAADPGMMFLLAVTMYALSWVLRGYVGEDLGTTLLSAAIILIAFITSFFRLSFNKLFFDQIQPGKAPLFILAKSGFTQTGVTFFFGLLTFYFSVSGTDESALTLVYWCSAPLSLVYLLYGVRFFRQAKRDSPVVSRETCTTVTRRQPSAAIPLRQGAQILLPDSTNSCNSL